MKKTAKSKKLRLGKETLHVLLTESTLKKIDGGSQDTFGFSCAKVGVTCTCPAAD